MITLDRIELRQQAFTLSLSLQVPRGRRLALLGPSGAGKSTLLNLIAGFATADAGQVRLDGQDVTRAPVAARPVSILFQDGNLFPHLSTFDNVALGLRPDLRLSDDQRARVDDSLARVGLAGFGARMPGNLSGGQQGRVALARMLLRDRPIALLDEPFAALDPGLRREMAALVGDLAEARAMTLIMVSHDLRGIEALATDLAVLSSGRLAAFGPIGELARNPPDALRPWL